MKQLTPPEYPRDFFYHRTGSSVYRKYLETCHLTTFDIGNPPQYAWKKKIFGNDVVVVKYERTDVEPDIDMIRETLGVKHGMISWIPYSLTEKPEGWRRLYLTDHYQETGYSLLEDADYPKKWNERARRARKKFLTSGWVVKAVTHDEYVTAFRATKVKHWYKSDYISYYKKITSIAPESIRQWICYDPSGKAVAGLAVHDYNGDHSVHLSAFTGKDAYPIQWGTGLIDEWYRSSLDMGIKYLSFDQLRQRWWPSEQRWYTEFKKNFIDFGLSFPKAYFKFF
jgi:hypothetical protein